MNETANMAPEGQRNQQTMPKEMKAKWLAALRSGEYKQATGGLYNPKYDDGKGGYCCLGACQMALDGHVEADPFEPERSREYPSIGWSVLHDLPHRECAGFNPELTINGKTIWASEHNDSLNATFLEIADAIEEQIEGV